MKTIEIGDMLYEHLVREYEKDSTTPFKEDRSWVYAK